MEHETKQRVVGTIVLLALAAIFLPFILDGDGSYQPAISSRIPETPVVDVMPEPIPQRPVIAADNFQDAEPDPVITIVNDADADEAETVAETDPAGRIDADQLSEPAEASMPSLDERSLPEGWSVRLGVFANARNASNLNQRLLDAGYRAYTRELPGAGGVVTGVFVGPQVDRAQANRLKTELQSEFRLSGLVVKFEVDEI